MTRVLVVEDDERERAGMVEALRDGGVTAHEAADGRVALELLSAGLRPDLILLDLMMPGMNGWEFRAAQLRDPELSPIPILVIVEGGAEEEAVERLAASGALRRPFRPEHLLEVVWQSATPP